MNSKGGEACLPFLHVFFSSVCLAAGFTSLQINYLRPGLYDLFKTFSTVSAELLSF